MDGGVITLKITTEIQNDSPNILTEWMCHGKDLSDRVKEVGTSLSPLPNGRGLGHWWEAGP
jgi:hypothetical protein